MKIILKNFSPNFLEVKKEAVKGKLYDFVLQPKISRSTPVPLFSLLNYLKEIFQNALRIKKNIFH